MKIIIEELKFKAILGILEHERIQPQTVQIDCAIDYRYENESFINYADVVSLIEDKIVSSQFSLIEEAIDSLASFLKHHYPTIISLTLTLRKPEILPNCVVGITQKYNF